MDLGSEGLDEDGIPEDGRKKIFESRGSQNVTDQAHDETHPSWRRTVAALIAMTHRIKSIRRLGTATWVLTRIGRSIRVSDGARRNKGQSSWLLSLKSCSSSFVFGIAPAGKLQAPIGSGHHCRIIMSDRNEQRGM